MTEEQCQCRSQVGDEQRRYTDHQEFGQSLGRLVNIRKHRPDNKGQRREREQSPHRQEGRKSAVPV